MTNVGTVYVLIAILMVLHFVGDFVLQSHWMASNKSKNPKALVAHVLVYAVVISVLPMIFLVSKMIEIDTCILFIGINFIIHLAIDFITSRITSRLWAKQSWHNFFLVVGFDQLLHMLTLIATLGWLIDTITIPLNIPIILH